MNCANHPDRERQAFCQNCGKPLCRECARVVGQAVFCEPCLEARLAGTGPLPNTPPPPPPGPFGSGPTTANASYQTVPGGGTAYTYTGTVEGIPYAASGVHPPAGTPNPALAALLGFIPGVGAMYNGQYAKGIVHLVIFAVLISLSDHNGIFAFFVAGWIFYQAFEAYDTARARRAGTPLPNPFGLNDIGERFGFGRAWAAGTPAAYPPPSAGAGSPPAAPPPGTYPNTPPTAHPPSPEPPAPAAYAAAPSTAIQPLPLTQARSSEWSSATPPPSADPSTVQDQVPPVPPPNPFPPASPPAAYSPALPIGAIILIALGLLFLLGDSGWFVRLPFYLIIPALLIGLGIWIFIRRMTVGGLSLSDDGSANYRLRLLGAVRSSIWVTLVGVLFLLDELRIISWGRSWPLFIIAIGVVAFLRRSVAADIRRRTADDAFAASSGFHPSSATTESNR